MNEAAFKKLANLTPEQEAALSEEEILRLIDDVIYAPKLNGFVMDSDLVPRASTKPTTSTSALEPET